jgi:hypothetical protein
MLTAVRHNWCVALISITLLVQSNNVTAGDCDEARKWYQEGLALSDSSEREVSYHQRAIELCPNYFEAHNRLGEIYKIWGEYELAIKEFQEAARAPSFTEPHINLGEIYRMQGRYDLAVEEFTKAIKVKPDSPRAQNQLKYVHKRLGKYEHTIQAPPDLIPTSIFARIPGMTLPKGMFLVDFQYKLWNQEAGLDVEAPVFAGTGRRDVDVQVWIWGIRYGLTNSLTIGLIPKIFSTTANVSFRDFGIDAEPTVTGFGDTVFVTKYRLYGRRRTHLSAFHLLSIPTGDEKAEGEDQGVVRRIPLGSGNLDFSPGVAFTTVIEPFTIHANIWYVIAGGTSARQGGDEFHNDLAVAFPPFHDFTFITELNYRWVDGAERRVLFSRRLGFRPPPESPLFPGGPETYETTLTEKGGHTLFFSPGFQLSLAEDLKAELGIQIPIITPDEGWAEGIVFHLGLRKYFF